jgi:hypothetical protein
MHRCHRVIFTDFSTLSQFSIVLLWDFKSMTTAPTFSKVLAITYIGFQCNWITQVKMTTDFNA